MSDDAGVSHRGRWLLGVALVVVVYAVGLAIVGVGDALEALVAAALLPLLVAAGLEAATVASLAMVHRASARAVDGVIRYGRALEVSMSAFTLSQTLPGGGAVAAAVAVRRLRRAGLDGPQATASVALTGTLAFATIAALAACGAAIAVADAELPPATLVVILAVLFVLLGAALAVVATVRSPDVKARLARLLGRVRRLRDRVEGWHEDLAALEDDPPRTGDLVRIVAWSTVNWTADIAALGFVFVALGQDPDPSVLLLGFGFAQIGAAVPITPGGVGFAESGMVGAFVALGVPAAAATTIVLTYRVLATWLPALAGVPALVRPARDDDGTADREGRAEDAGGTREPR